MWSIYEKLKGCFTLFSKGIRVVWFLGHANSNTWQILVGGNPPPNQTPAEVRRTLEQLEGSALGARAQTNDD